MGGRKRAMNLLQPQLLRNIHPDGCVCVSKHATEARERVGPVILAHRWYHVIHRLPRLPRELRLWKERI